MFLYGELREIFEAIFGTQQDNSAWNTNVPRSKHQLPSRPGGNQGTNEWFRQSNPIQMLPPGDSICGRLSSDLPSTRLQGGGMEATSGAGSVRTLPSLADAVRLILYHYNTTQRILCFY